MMEREPKSIDDYKDVVKILKLKIIKQNKRIQQLELKNKTYEEQINGVTLRGDDIQISSRIMADFQNQTKQKRQEKQSSMNTLKGKVEVMNDFAKGIKKIGITPDGLFRLADYAYKNFVESEYFREILGKMKLGLTQKQISCLIFIFDEFYTGFITKEDYCNSLHAYKISVESSYHQYIQDSVFKLSQMMHNDKINAIKFYQEMESKSTSRVGNKKTIQLNVFEDQVKKYYGGQISEKEIVAAFNAIDLESVGYLEKNNFLYSITSCINKLLSGDEALSRKTQPQWNTNGKSHITENNPVDSVRMTPKKPEKVIDNHPSGDSRLNNPYTPDRQILQIYQSTYKLTLFNMYEQIMLDPLSNRLTLKSFKKHLLSLNNQLPSPLINSLYKQIDQQQKGSIYFNELINYYLTKSSDNQIILRMMGKYFANNDLDSQKLMYVFGLTPDAQISKMKFLQMMKKNFQTKDEKSWQNFWSLFDKGRGSCNVGTIIKTLKRYEYQ